MARGGARVSTKFNAQDRTYQLQDGARLCWDDVLTVAQFQELLAFHLKRVDPQRPPTRPGSVLPVAPQIPKFVPVWDVAFARRSEPGSPPDPSPVPTGVQHAAFHAWAFAVLEAGSGPPCGAPRLAGLWILRGGASPSGLDFSPDGAAVFGCPAGPSMAVLDASARMPARPMALAEGDGGRILWDGAGGFSTESAGSPRGAYFVVARRAGVR